MDISTSQNRRKVAEDFTEFELKKYKRDLDILKQKGNLYAQALDRPIDWPVPEKSGQGLVYTFQNKEGFNDTYYFRRLIPAGILWLLAISSAIVAIDKFGMIIGPENYLLLIIPALYFSVRAWQAGQEKYSGKLEKISGTIKSLFCYIPSGRYLFTTTRQGPYFMATVADDSTGKNKKFEITRYMYHALSVGSQIEIFGFPSRRRVDSLKVYTSMPLAEITERQMINKEIKASAKEFLKGIALSIYSIPLIVVLILGFWVFVAIVVRALLGN